MQTLISILLFPGGLFILLNGMVYEWLDRFIVARLQNRVGPRWFQPVADTVKLLAKEEVIPTGVDALLFVALPVVALAGPLTAMLYMPVAGLPPAHSFTGDLLVAIYLLSLLTLATGIAGANTNDSFSLVGATRTLTQLFSYEVPFLLALLGPAIAAGSWTIADVHAYAGGRWLVLAQPIGFIIAIIGLMGKLEMVPFDAPEAETEIVAGALTEYSGRGLALFFTSRYVELIGGLTLIAAFYLGGVGSFGAYLLKTMGVLLFIALLQTVLPRLRIDQTVGMWWRYGTLLVLLQWLIIALSRGVL